MRCNLITIIITIRMYAIKRLLDTCLNEKNEAQIKIRVMNTILHRKKLNLLETKCVYVFFI
jgi:hypothetical protein